MCEPETKTGIDIQKNRRNGPGKAFGPDFPAHFLQLPNKIQTCLKSQLKRFVKTKWGVNSGNSFVGEGKGSSTALEIDRENQIRAWRENPSWVDQPPEIKVSIPKGSFCNLRVKVDVGLPPDTIFDIVTDPDNRRVFKNIKEVISRTVLVDEGPRQVVEVEQAALWRFLWWSGTISVHVIVDQNRENHSMKFKQVKTGFMKKFEGCWRVEPLFLDEKACFPFKPKTWEDYYSCTGGKGRIGSKVTLEQVIQPAIIPPPPISWYLRGITTRTTEMLITDLLAEAARIRESFDSIKSNGELEAPQKIFDEHQFNNMLDIKERWALHRKNAKQCCRRLLTAKSTRDQL